MRIILRFLASECRTLGRGDLGQDGESFRWEHIGFELEFELTARYPGGDRVSSSGGTWGLVTCHWSLMITARSGNGCDHRGSERACAKKRDEATIGHAGQEGGGSERKEAWSER